MASRRRGRRKPGRPCLAGVAVFGRRAKAPGDDRVELTREALVGHRTLRPQRQRQLGELLLSRPPPAARPGPRRPRQAPVPPRGRAARRHEISLHASLSLVMTRCRLVPAFDSLIDSTRAISALLSPALNLSAIRSRSRGVERLERQLHHGCTRRIRPVGDRLVGLLTEQRRLPAAPPQLVQSRVARYPEQPCSLAPASGAEARALAIRTLEHRCGDVLGGASVPQQRRHVGVDVVPAGAVERLEAGDRSRVRRLRRHDQRVVHTLTTNDRPFHHTGIIGASARPIETGHPKVAV